MKDKKIKVRTLFTFRDLVECMQRYVGDEFWCTKERYEYLKEHNAVELVEEEKEVENVKKSAVSKKKKAK